MKTTPRWRVSSLALFLSALALTALAGASGASAQGTTQIESTPADHAWWPSASEKAREAPVALKVRDDQKLASWYIDHLGFQLAGLQGPVRAGGAQTRATTIYHDGFVLELQQRSAKAPQTLVLAVHDLAARVQELERAGIQLSAQDGRSATLRDPEGNVIQLVDDGSHARSLAKR